MLDWGKLLIVETTAIAGVMYGLGFLKAPRFLMRRKLSNRFPWGYYADQVPKDDEGYSAEHLDFMHDTGTEFGGGLEGFGEYGEFTGWGEMGEYGSTFFADGGSGAE